MHSDPAGFLGRVAPTYALLSNALERVSAYEVRRRRAVTVTTIGALVSMPLGPLLGGWLLSHFTWGWIFLINAPVTALALAGVWLLVPESRDLANPRLDWPGA